MTATAIAPDTLTLTRFEPPQPFAFHTEQECRGVVIDVETNGLDPETDRIIQIAILPFSFTRVGDITGIGKALVQVEDPGAPLPPEITRLTGLTDNDLALRVFDDEAIIAAIRGSDLIVAHNAEFDRGFLERRFGFFAGYRFACSMIDVPWKDEGYTSTKLEWLLFKHCGMFTDDAHRADIDCHAALYLLSTTLPSGRSAFSCVLDAARTKWVRLYAMNAPFATKDVLKARGYHWSDGNDGRPKAWFIDVPQSGASEETEWLAEDIRCLTWPYEFGARMRFSNRIGKQKPATG